jgi:hypothetical protein
MRLSPAIWLVAAALAGGCVASSTSNPPEDTSVGRDTIDDVAEDTEVDTTPDVAEPDTIVDTTPDVEPELPVLDCEVTGDECAPRSVICAEDGRTRIFCDRCGFIVNSEICPDSGFCEGEPGVSATCRACVDQECPDECTPNVRSCLDSTTVQVCGPDGSVANTAPCSDGRRCFEGSCGSPGNETGESCTTDIDVTNGCVGHLCVCGTPWVSTQGATECAGSLSGGYCATLNCSDNRCDYDEEVCADFSLSGRFGGLDMCITRAGCTRRDAPCGRAGMSCEFFPGRRGPTAPLSWELGCFLSDFKTIGEPCTGNQDCLGGECRVGDVAGAAVSYCTSPCGDGGGCPDHAVCVEDPDDEGEYVCLAKPNATDCPRISTEPLRIRSTPPLRRYTGGTTTACYFAQ